MLDTRRLLIGLTWLGAAAVTSAVFGPVAPAKVPPHVVVVPPAVGNHLPPLQYDFPYDGELIIVRVKSEADVQRICKLPFPSLACAKMFEGEIWGGRFVERCEITMVSDELIRAEGHDPEIVLRHEHGHCNGWAPDHQGVRPNNSPSLVKHQELPPNPPPSNPKCHPPELAFSVGCSSRWRLTREVAPEDREAPDELRVPVTEFLRLNKCHVGGRA